MDKGDIRFFLASKTERGFVSYFERLLGAEGCATVVLKGGPGSGKSTLMKKIGRALLQQGHTVEFIPCASDPDSLDAIVDVTARRAVIDGTAPHMLDPVYPGARDALINLGGAWDAALLREQKDEIIRLSNEVNDCHAEAAAYVSAAGALLRRCRSIAARHVDEKAVRAVLGGLRLPQSAEGAHEREYRLLSAVSVGRVEFFEHTLGALCAEVIAVSDEWGAASGLLLERVANAAREADRPAIVCPCSVIAEKTDHVLLPDLGVAFTCANPFHDAASLAARRIEGLYTRIPERELSALRALTARAGELIASACAAVALSKALHDELERIYVAAMDFSKLDALYDEAMALLF